MMMASGNSRDPAAARARGGHVVRGRGRVGRRGRRDTPRRARGRRDTARRARGMRRYDRNGTSSKLA